MPNSEVKRSIADGSVGFPHVRVGHCQGFIIKPPHLMRRLSSFVNNGSVNVVKQVLSEREVKNEMTALSRQESYVAFGKRSSDTEHCLQSEAVRKPRVTIVVSPSQ